MFETEIIARNYTDDEMRNLLLDVFSHVPEHRTPFFVRLMRRQKKYSVTAEKR